MKKFLSTVFVAIAGIALFSACTRHNIVITDPSSGSMNAIAAGKAITSTNCLGTQGSGVSIITASFGNNTNITFNLKTSILTATTYNVDSSGADNNVEYSPNGVPVLSRSGSMVITNINPGINYTGSFNFTCVDGTVVSGTFTATAIK